MTDPVTADNIYLKPLTVESIEEILKKHKIDAVLPTMGGQTALNLAIECEKLGIWKEYGVRMIGVDVAAIDITENREQFRLLMERIGVPMAPSKTVTSFLEGKQVAQEFGFPLVIRASYTLGGAGAAFVKNAEDFDKLLKHGLQVSPIHEVMIDKALLGWKEYELELLRDKDDNVSHHLLHRELRPDGHPHRRQHHRGAGDDPQRPHLPAHAHRGHQDDALHRRLRGRLQRAVRGEPR